MLGYAVDDNSIRLSNYLHVLRELVHLSCGQLALEPRFEVKALIADHLHDDARAVTKIRRRLYELRAPGDHPGAPSAELAALLDRAGDAADTHEYLQIAYGELKPTLIAALRTNLQQLDPILDEPGLRLLTRLLHRQERHITELPAGREQSAFADLGALPLRLGEERELKPLPPLDRPARDDFIEVGGRDPAEPAEPSRFFHDLMDAELCAAELTARNSHEHPGMPWDFHVDMARQCWDEIRHAEIIDRLMATELGCHWGDHPVGLDSFESIYALDLLDRLALSSGTRDRRSPPIDSDQGAVARVFEYLLAEDAAHADNAVRWGTHLAGGDEDAYSERARELRDRAGAPVQSS